jgi:sec-independent protein translocase protein TatB
MFDFAWTEIALVGVVALVAIGPKDLPVAIKTVAQMVKKARGMASEFQGHFDEMVREANLGDVRNQINELRSFDVKGAIEKAIDGDGAIRSSYDDATAHDWGASVPGLATEGDAEIGTMPEHVIGAPNGLEEAAMAASPMSYDAPAFIPPAIAARAAAPAFIPPHATRS